MEKLKPEKFVEMMRKNGVEVSREEAAITLEFLRKLANIVVAQYLEKQKPDRK